MPRSNPPELSHKIAPEFARLRRRTERYCNPLVEGPGEYRDHTCASLIATLVAVRHASGIRQQALAKRLGKPQSFIAKYEGGERRIDLIEFIAIVRALEADPEKLFRDFVAGKAPPKVLRKRSTG